LYPTQFLAEELTFYDSILNSLSCVELVLKTADEIRTIFFFFKSFGVKRINDLVVTGQKSINNFAGLVTSGPRSPVVPCSSILNTTTP
jgi:hypothetical protein